MRYSRVAFALASLAAAAASDSAVAQSTRERDQDRDRAREERDDDRDRRRRVWTMIGGDDDRPRLGISTSSGSRRDTLGILVNDVTEGGPADKAGLEEGDRIASINGVNLRLSKEDAGEEDMEGILQRRLMRELDKHKAGDEVDLRVWSNGAFKNVKVKLAAPEDLFRRFSKVDLEDELENRAALGVSVGSNGSRRDTLGVLVSAVTEDGPAEKAGIVEGDRLVSLNGVDLRVPAEDAGDWSSSSTRVRRLYRELEKLKPGDDAELRVYSGGQTRTVRVKTGKASELTRGGMSFFYGDGPGAGIRIAPSPRAPMMMKAPAPPMMYKSPRPPRAPRAPDVRWYDFDDAGDLRLHLGPAIREGIDAGMDGLREGLRSLRRALPSEVWVDLDVGPVNLDIDDDVDDAVDDAADDFDEPATSPSPTPDAGPLTGSRRRVAPEPMARIATARVGDVVRAVPAVATTQDVSARPSHSAIWTGEAGDLYFLGLRLTRVEGDLAAYLGDGSEEGVLLLDVGRGWNGLRRGDVLLRIDGRPVRRGDVVRLDLEDRASHEIDLLRAGKRVTVTASFHGVD